MEAAQAAWTQAARTMCALAYHGPGMRALEDKPRPALKDASDAIVYETFANAARERALKVIVRSA